jgi:hypothetical protein
VFRNVVAVVALVACFGAAAQSEPHTANTWRLAKDAARPLAKIDVAAWLVGQYGGTGLGGEVEYQWLPPRAGQMYGTFRSMRDGKTVFAEILQLAEVDGTLALRVKHFSNDFVAWEEKEKFVEFKLNEVRADELRFDGLTLRRAPDGVRGFVAFLARAAGAGTDAPKTLSEGEFVFVRLPR